MSKQDVESALYDLESALAIILDRVPMPVSGRTYRFYKDARQNLSRARKSLEQLHEHPYKDVVETPEDYVPNECYCNTTNFPPCGFCTREVS